MARQQRKPDRVILAILWTSTVLFTTGSFLVGYLWYAPARDNQITTTCLRRSSGLVLDLCNSSTTCYSDFSGHEHCGYYTYRCYYVELRYTLQYPNGSDWHTKRGRKEFGISLEHALGLMALERVPCAYEADNMAHSLTLGDLDFLWVETISVILIPSIAAFFLAYAIVETVRYIELKKQQDNSIELYGASSP